MTFFREAWDEYARPYQSPSAPRTEADRAATPVRLDGRAARDRRPGRRRARAHHPGIADREPEQPQHAAQDRDRQARRADQGDRQAARADLTGAGAQAGRRDTAGDAQRVSPPARPGRAAAAGWHLP